MLFYGQSNQFKYTQGSNILRILPDAVKESATIAGVPCGKKDVGALKPSSRAVVILYGWKGTGAEGFFNVYRILNSQITLPGLNINSRVY